MKRAGENLARTVDGAQYNKLQRPDEFPEAPPRPVVNRSIPTEGSPALIENEEDGSINTTPEDASNRTPSQTPPARMRWKSKRDAAPKGAFFPGLDDYDTGGSSDEDEEYREAMRYLRQVRNEESGLPTVVRAQSPILDDHDFDTKIYTNGIGDSRGYFSEGTYIAAPTIGSDLPNDEYYLSDEDDFARVVSMSPQEAHTTRILSLFNRQRSILQMTPPAKLNPLHEMSCHERINKHDPSPAALVAMSMATTYAMLKLVTKQLKKSRNIAPRMSAWIMSILAKMDEKLMDGDSVYLVRELSKKAMWVRFSFDERFTELTANAEYNQESQFGGPDDRKDDGGPSRGRREVQDDLPRRRNTSSLSSYRASDSVHDPELKIDDASLPSMAEVRPSKLPATKPISELMMDDALLPTAAEARLGTATAIEAARLRLLEKIEKEVQDDIPIKDKKDRGPDVLDSNTRATIDMIITIVGEIYGQKDLLEGRIDWLHLDEEDEDVQDKDNGKAP
ncbi:hypothetical protein E2P81_ATG09770 [Venturia nashicola]|uniref:Uncharacterized protein n=1 Tax=Venturia nashicola TaxID=86259 RepID=A0A4Z1P0D9_9PEZI|nr:hypothetical protein E6O75_ATG09986 [Venturia nashicola]TLD14780.1 hypothetical protein E2P81_ATG09770 [Venturia nashicola]